jgi:hypothetical protein
MQLLFDKKRGKKSIENKADIFVTVMDASSSIITSRPLAQQDAK